ncbi:MAG: type II toxin-antitoxin system VapC family toxin [Actinomycetota bacterium]
MTLVVDTSAIVAMLLDEPSAVVVEQALAEADERVMSAATVVDLMIVAESRKGPAGAQKVEEIVRESEIEIVAHDDRCASLAIEGWRRFGKGRHPAALNLGDCFAYGLARSLGAPLLCVGDDFARTDIDTVL